MLMIRNLCEKKSRKHSKKETKSKTVTVIHPDGSNDRTSNYVKIIDKKHVSFDPTRGLKKSLIHEK